MWDLQLWVAAEHQVEEKLMMQVMGTAMPVVLIVSAGSVQKCSAFFRQGPVFASVVPSPVVETAKHSAYHATSLGSNPSLYTLLTFSMNSLVNSRCFSTAASSGSWPPTLRGPVAFEELDGVPMSFIDLARSWIPSSTLARPKREKSVGVRSRNMV